MIKTGQVWKSKHNGTEIKVVSFDPESDTMEYRLKLPYISFSEDINTVHIILRLFIENWEILSNNESIEGEMFI